MHITVEFLFDAASTDSIHRIGLSLQREFAPMDESDYAAPPHIRLAALEEEPAALRSTVEELASHLKPVRLDLNKVASFPQGVIYLAPTDATALIGVQASLQEALAIEKIRGNPYYDPAVWQPHCTVAVGISSEQIGDALRSCRKMLPIPPVTIEQVAVLTYGPFNELYKFHLGQGLERRCKG
jgi:2'-5' RNA ligase